MDIASIIVVLVAAIVFALLFARYIAAIKRRDAVAEQNNVLAQQMALLVPGVITVDGGVVTYRNRWVDELLCLSGQPDIKFLELIHSQDLDQAKLWLDQQPRTSATFRLQGAEEQPTWVRFHPVPGTDNCQGNAPRQYMLSDVSGEYRVVENQIRSRRLQGVGMLAAGVAHDFNNLLTVITAFAETLDPGEARTKILSAADDTASLVDTLAAFAGPSLLGAQRLELSQWLGLVEPLLRTNLPSAVELKISAPQQQVWVGLDGPSLNQIVVQLMANAEESLQQSNLGGDTDTAPTIWIDLELVSRAADLGSAGTKESSPRDYALLTISDNGLGISDDLRPRVFEPFFSTKQNPPGAGLGLTTVQSLVHRAGGFVEIESAATRGASVALYLPVAASVVQDAGAAGGFDLTPELLSARILVVEDDERVAEVVARSLAGVGFSVTLRHDTDSAWRYVQQDKPDLVVADVVMPSRGDTDLLPRFGMLPPEDMPAILLLSGYAGEQHAALNVPTHALEILSKPFRAADLLERVVRLLHLRRERMS